MADISTALVEQYSMNITMLSQQMGSRLAPYVDTETIRGKNAFFDQIGQGAAVEITSRHMDTPITDPPHARRRVSLKGYVYAPMIDDFDKVRMLADPQSSYVKSAVAAMGRAKDDVIIAAALGTAYTGVDGSTAVTFPSSQIISAGASGLTKDKLISAKGMFLANEVDPEIPLYLAVSSDQIEDLLSVTEVTSSDYNTVKALVAGEVDTFVGFKFIHSERLDSSGSTRKCIAWAEDGIKLAIGRDLEIDIAPRRDKNNSIQVLTKMFLGATRMEEEKVVEIDCAE